MKLNVMSRAEQKYTFAQSQQISGQTALIGHLRADMGNGTESYSSWDAKDDSLVTTDFHADLAAVVSFLRQKGNILFNLSALRSYCYSNPQSKFVNENDDYYGACVETEKYSFLLRLCPHKGENNLYMYCYLREPLHSHLNNASRGIRFTDAAYKTRFIIPDGGKINITSEDGAKKICVCRYIDQTHVEVSGQLYHIHQFAETMESGGKEYEPVSVTLPDRCFSVLPGTSEVIRIRRGDGWYGTCLYHFENAEEAERGIRELNRNIGITDEQAEALKDATLFSWNIPEAKQ